MNSSNILFKKKNLVIKTSDINWVKSHTWVPTAFKIDNSDKVIVFFAGRNKLNESDTGYFIYDLNKNKVTKICKKPILRRGNLGSFDDSAVIPSHLIKIRKKYYLYYVGWTQGKKVPFFSNLGLAVSSRITGPFKKFSNSPILGKSKYDPYFVATCFVDKIKGAYEMFYTSNLYWKKINNIPYPRYIIKRCTSTNGINWKVKGEKIINFQSKNEVAITRPWIVKIKKKKVMFFSLKRKKYNIMTSINNGKSNWKRIKIFEFMKNKKINFDTDSQEYASIIKHKNKLYMFYNGNEYGRDGIGLAIANIND